MLNWTPLTNKEYFHIWNKVNEYYNFKPSTTNFPSFKVPSPFVTYDVSCYFGESLDLEAYNDLEEKTLLAFKENTAKDECILALDWQHEGYWVNPHLKFERDELGEWCVPLFPDGDYYFFIQKDFKWGYLGHPWGKSITIFGDELLNAFEKHKPNMFRKALRQG